MWGHSKKSVPRICCAPPAYDVFMAGVLEPYSRGQALSPSASERREMAREIMKLRCPYCNANVLGITSYRHEEAGCGKCGWVGKIPSGEAS